MMHSLKNERYSEPTRTFGIKSQEPELHNKGPVLDKCLFVTHKETYSSSISEPLLFLFELSKSLEVIFRYVFYEDRTRRSKE